MSDPKHLFTVHATYTGRGCAHCGNGLDGHPTDQYQDNGVIKPLSDGYVEGEDTDCQPAF